LTEWITKKILNAKGGKKEKPPFLYFGNFDFEISRFKPRFCNPNKLQRSPFRQTFNRKFGLLIAR
jgi:hypothetical protein